MKINKRDSDLRFKDKIRHGGKRVELLKDVKKVFGYECPKCHTIVTSFQLVAHHTTGNNKEHEFQEPLCRSCHMKEHVGNGKHWNMKHITKEQIEAALLQFDNLKSAAKFLGISRCVLYTKRKMFRLENLKLVRGFSRVCKVQHDSLDLNNTN